MTFKDNLSIKQIKIQIRFMKMIVKTRKKGKSSRI